MEDVHAAASPADARSDAATSDVARVVYLIASHVHPPQVARLARACLSGSSRSRVLISHDYNCSNLDADAVRAIDPDRIDVFRGRTKIDWGRFNQQMPVIHSLEWLLKHHEFDWVVSLSGQDYPVQPLARIERFLTDTPYDGFLDAKPVDACSWLDGAQRYYYQYYAPPKFRGWSKLRDLIRARAERTRAAGGEPRLLIPQFLDDGKFRVGYRPVQSPFRDGYKCYFGSCWWTLNRKSIEHMMRVYRERPEIERWYGRVLFAVNESYFQTLLLNNPDLNLVTDDEKRYVGWQDHHHTGHPDVLGSKDIPALIASGDHFARKLDERKNPAALDMLDEHIGLRRAEVGA